MATKKIRTTEDLRTAIRELEDQHYVNEQFMRKRIAQIIEDLKPINLIKSVVRQVVTGPSVKTNFLRMAAGLATSFVMKKFLNRSKVH
jgi:hypothetical protein